MAEVGFTSVPIEIPTGSLAEYEAVLSLIGGLPVSPANAKKVAAQIIHDAVEARRQRERWQSTVPIEAPK